MQKREKRWPEVQGEDRVGPSLKSSDVSCLSKAEQWAPRALAELSLPTAKDTRCWGLALNSGCCQVQGGRGWDTSTDIQPCTGRGLKTG